MPEPTTDLWTAMSTARTIRRFTDQPVDDATLTRCLRAATWAPSGANVQEWRFIVLRSRTCAPSSERPPPRPCKSSNRSIG